MGRDEARAALRTGGAVIGALVLVALVLVGVWLLHTRAPYAGTNSLAPRYNLPALAPGHRLCSIGLTLPADADALRLRLVSADAAPAPVALRITAAGRTQTASAVAPPGNFGNVDFHFAAPGHDVPARFCLTARRTVGAASGYNADATAGAALLDGKPVGQFSVWYLRLPARHVLAALPDGAHRASLFRAGFVGAWTYAVLALLLVAAWVAGLRLVLRRMA
jgi:hypothetical protein